MKKPDFLASTEGYDLELPRKCWVIKTVNVDVGRDGLLIQVDPPINILDIGRLSEVIVVSRHSGISLSPIRSWPIYVHVACNSSKKEHGVNYITAKKTLKIKNVI